MKRLTHTWRPEQQIRAKALGLPFRGGRTLVAAVCTDDGSVTGWRPLGGTVEFGESAETTVVRELAEELGAEAKISRHLGTFENIYTHQGQTGHEIIFAFEVALIDPGHAVADDFIVEDGSQRFRAAWIPIHDFVTGSKVLLPHNLLPLVPADWAT
ncbi:MAG: NUDIX domain-containing protein [Pseudomonadota bacterium]